MQSFYLICEVKVYKNPSFNDIEIEKKINDIYKFDQQLNFDQWFETDIPNRKDTLLLLFCTKVSFIPQPG